MNARAKTILLGGGVLLVGILPVLLYWPLFQQPMPPNCIFTRNTALSEQWLVVITALAVKPAYMLLSLGWIIWLWKRRATDLVALRWGLICFLAGEIACAVNYLLFGSNSAFTDYLHSYGMAVGFSFVAYAALEGADFRVVKYSPPDARCALLGLCRSCVKHADVPCALRRLFAFLIPALIAVSWMLPSAELKPLSLRTDILGGTQDFSAPLWSQRFEGQYCATLSIVLLLASWIALLFKRNNPVATAKLFFAAAMGPLGFGLMRLFLRTAYAANLVWSNIWEELTELIFILGVGVVLWLFRETLFRESSLPRQAHAHIV